MGIRRRAMLTSAAALVTVPFAVAMAASAATAAPAAPVAHTAAAHAAKATTDGATVITTERTKFGTVLVTGTGESLYTFTGDEFPFAAAGPQLNCTGLNVAASGTPCTTAWPPLTASSVVAKNGVRQRELRTVTRDGVTQVTYFGKPLYGFIADKAANDVNGEDVSAFDGNWYLDHTDGLPAVETPTVSTEVSPNGIVLASSTASGTRSLYLLTADTPGTSACGTAGGCVALWPPLLTNHRATAGTGTDRHLIGAIRRSDGTFQVTYAGHPLYFFALDLAAGAAAGETNGEHLLDPTPVDGVWYTLLPNGNPDAGPADIQSESANGTSILADAGVVNGVVATLYAFSADTPTQSNCTGMCAQAWPPVLTQSAPTASGAASGSLRRDLPGSEVTPSSA
jgi:predicted lipoprotein with Yx(FWY)xxD motif